MFRILFLIFCQIILVGGQETCRYFDPSDGKLYESDCIPKSECIASDGIVSFLLLFFLFKTI